MHKRIWAWLLTLTMLLGFTACGGKDAPRIGLCLRQCDSGITAESVDHLDTVLGQVGYQVQVMDAGMDQTKQTRQIRGLIEEGIDLLVIEPVMVSAAADIAALAKEADIPVIFYQQEPDAAVLDSWRKLCYVGSDPTQPGLLQGQLLLQTANSGDINGDGIVSYFVIGGPEDHMDTRQRTADCVTGLTEAGLQAECIGTAWGDWSRESGQQLAAQALAEFGKDIEVIFCNNDAMAIGALEAIQDGGRTVGKDVCLVGIDGERHAQVLIRSGELTGTVAQDLQTQAELIAELADKLLRGRNVEKVNYTDYVALTQGNIEEFMAE